MNWKKSFIEEYAGHPLKVALNLFIVAALGILAGHYLFDTPISARLILGAMLPALGAVVIAGRMKAQAAPRR